MVVHDSHRETLISWAVTTEVFGSDVKTKGEGSVRLGDCYGGR